MTDATDMTQRHGATLARLAELGLSLAEQLHADAMAAETPEARADLAKSFHTVSRSVRQTLALEARFCRDARREDAVARVEAEHRAERTAQVRQAERKTRVRRSLQHLAWNEWDLSEYQAQRVLHDAEQKLGGLDFDLDEPIEDQIFLLCRRLGYTPVKPADPAPAPPKARHTAKRRPAPVNGRLAPPTDLPRWADDSS